MDIHQQKIFTCNRSIANLERRLSAMVEELEF